MRYKKEPKNFEVLHKLYLSIGYYPVSYTHLDVYKRQISGDCIIPIKTQKSNWFSEKGDKT